MRGAIAGALKETLGLAVVSEKIEDGAGLSYRLTQSLDRQMKNSALRRPSSPSRPSQPSQEAFPCRRCQCHRAGNSGNFPAAR